MKQLELKHLAGYLPYNVKVMSGFNEYSEIDALYFSKDGHKRPSLNLMVSHSPKGFRGENLKDIKLILHPFSDFNKEIEHNGEKFVPRNKFIGNPLDYRTLENSYTVVQQLLEWHFDIHGLIEKGLAIDINTLKP